MERKVEASARTVGRYSAFLVLPLALIACGEQSVSRSETTSLAEPTATVAACLEKFSRGKDTWRGDQVLASFFYDATALDGDKSKTFFGNDPAERGSHRIVISNGDSEQARKEFLEGERGGDTAMLETDDITLFRVNYGPGDFETVLREGCERSNDDVSVIQVTFSQGAL